MTLEIGPDQTESDGMLPGLGAAARIRFDLLESVRIAIDARREAGVIDDLDAAMVALAVSDATKLDATVDVGRPSGRAKLIQSMSDVLEALPVPEEKRADALDAFVGLITGREIETNSSGEEFVPICDPPSTQMGTQEQGVRTTLRARHAAGLSTRTYAGHERLALMASHDLDRALSVGAPSGYALLANVMQTVLERLPRPAATSAADLDALLTAAQPDALGKNPFAALPPAAHHPERDESWDSEGEEIAAVARAMGRHLMPWQRKAIDVATEYRTDADGHRRYRYSEVVITVPRQSGKTDVTGPVQLHRALTRGADTAVWFTAQTGQDARKRMVELIERAMSSPLAALLTPTRSNGAEGLRVKSRANCHVTRFSPTFSALHGEHPTLVTMDEFWHFTKDLGDALDGAIEPAQITLGSRAQTWRVSTMGTVASDYMNAIIERGRAGTDPALCYIEYSCPEDLDPFDPESWPQFHPAVGNTISVEDLAVRAARAQNDPARRATFQRAYANRIVASDGSLIDLAAWDDLQIDVPPPPTSEVVLAFEVAPGNEGAAITAHWHDRATGRPCTRIVHQAPGTRWLVPELERLHQAWDPRGIAADSAGPAQRHLADLEARGIPVQTLSMSEFGQACEGLLDAAGAEGTLIHDGSDELRAQAAAADVRWSNGVRRFSRSGPVPIPALIATAVGLHALEHPDVAVPTIVL